MGFSQTTTVLILAGINLFVIMVVVVFGQWGNLNMLLALLAISILLSIFLGVYKSRGAQSVSKA